MSSNLFHQLSTGPVDISQVTSAIDALGEWQISPFDFDYKQLGPNDTPSVLQPLVDNMGMRAGRVLRITPGSCYNWHIDASRRCSINIALSLGESMCLFKKNTRSGQQGATWRFFDVVPVYYTPGHAYLFNTSQPHCVINHGSTDRVVVSYSFPLPTTFAQVKDYCDSIGL